MTESFFCALGLCSRSASEKGRGSRSVVMDIRKILDCARCSICCAKLLVLSVALNKYLSAGTELRKPTVYAFARSHSFISRGLISSDFKDCPLHSKVNSKPKTGSKAGRRAMIFFMRHIL